MREHHSWCLTKPSMWISFNHKEDLSREKTLNHFLLKSILRSSFLKYRIYLNFRLGLSEKTILMLLYLFRSCCCIYSVLSSHVVLARYDSSRPEVASSNIGDRILARQD